MFCFIKKLKLRNKKKESLTGLNRKREFNQPRFSKENGAGFTLVEIMVVVAITVLIATIILVSMGESRKEARDAAIKTSLGEIRKASEFLYDLNSSYIGVCDPNPPGDDSLSGSGDFDRIEVYIEAQGGAVFCRESLTAYATISILNRGGCWCVDSLGAAREIALSGSETCQSKLPTTECP